MSERAALPTSAPIDAVRLTSAVSGDALRARLDELLTRSFYSGAGYVFESDPYVVDEDDALLRAFATVREGDRRHSHLLGTVIANRGGVPQPGVFPWWDLDLNYLTVPTLGRFVVESMKEELGLYDALLAVWPADDPASKATLSWVRSDKAAQLTELAPLVEAALARDAAAVKAGIESVKKTRAAKLAKKKAADEAAKKAKAAAAAGAKPGAARPAAAAPVSAAAPAAASLDPNEPGISKKEKGRRAVMRLRAAAGIATPGAAAPTVASTAAAPAAAVGGADLPDPNEPGISPKEKARRQMLKMRAASAPASAAPAPAAAPPIAAPAAADLPDPNEPGISPKEKAKRQMMKMRAASAPASAAAPAPASSAAPSPAAAAPAAPAVEDLGDPDEPGLSPKEKARRKVARMRAGRS